MPVKPSLYDVLGLDPTATQEQVRKAYKVKALETHPDKLDPGASEQAKQLAEKRFHQVHEAFEILNDSRKRRAYDSRSRPRTTSLPATSTTQVPADEVDRLRQDRAEWARQQQARYQQTKPQIPKPGPTRSYTTPASQTYPSFASRSVPKPAPVPPQRPQPTKTHPVPPKPMTPEENVDVQLVESMMQGLRQLDPEWEKRRMSVLQRRADRITSNARPSTVRM
ncbi:hypothetical protein PM082_010908 [Marasmius tenuissimus]|nr:hypothetical protein PM082_010908 [Marasmius tenuissimus]